MNPSFSLAKLLKKANVDVCFIMHHNTYVVNPPWTKRSFKGRINTTIECLKKEELKVMSLDVIYQTVIEYLYYDPYLYNETAKLKYKMNDIKGLEHTFYTCPSCKNETITSSYDILICTICNQKMHFDSYGKLDNKGIKHYLDISKEFKKREHQKDPSYTLSAPVDLYMYKDKIMKIVGSGTISLNLDRYLYELGGHKYA